MSTHVASPAVAPPTRPGEPALSVTGLRKSYRDKQVLHDVSFEVQPQEIFGILGPNGAGKTTAVEVAQGLRRADAGTISVLGLDPARDRPRLRHLVGSQLQSSALPERLKVGEALRLFARLAGDVVDWRELRDQWDLARLERSSFGSLSGGERQRLFIALALVNRPQLVFLDELTQGLDPAARRDTWRLVRQVRELGTTVVLVTHFMDEAEQLADRVAILHDGRITACDTPGRLVAGAGGHVHIRFSARSAAVISGLEVLDGVRSVAHDGERADVVGDPRSPVLVAAELARNNVVPTDFTVERPTLEDAFVTLTTGGAP